MLKKNVKNSPTHHVIRAYTRTSEVKSDQLYISSFFYSCVFLFVWFSWRRKKVREKNLKILFSRPPKLFFICELFPRRTIKKKDLRKKNVFNFYSFIPPSKVFACLLRWDLSFLPLSNQPSTMHRLCLSIHNSQTIGKNRFILVKH